VVRRKQRIACICCGRCQSHQSSSKNKWSGVCAHDFFQSNWTECNAHSFKYRMRTHVHAGDIMYRRPKRLLIQRQGEWALPWCVTGERERNKIWRCCVWEEAFYFSFGAARVLYLNPKVCTRFGAAESFYKWQRSRVINSLKWNAACGFLGFSKCICYSFLIYFVALSVLFLVVYVVIFREWRKHILSSDLRDLLLEI
jgi:hypothetical protein